MQPKNKSRATKRQIKLRLRNKRLGQKFSPDFDPKMSNKERLKARRAAKVYREHGDI